MGPAQGIQGHQAIQTLNNDIYGSAGGNNSSSYVSSSGIKSVLLNVWNAVKSAVSGILSSFGSHLTGQQGSDKPGREIAMDISSRPAQPLPDINEQFDNMLYGSNNDEDIYFEIDENASAETDDPANHIYEDLNGYRVVNDETGTAEADDPANHIYEDLDDYRRTGNVIGSEDRVLVCDDTYAEPHDSLKAGSRAEQEGMGSEYESLHENIYSELYKPGDTISTPENNPQGESDYADPKELQFNQEQLLQRIAGDKLNRP
ncbi:TPA: hypothetical protein PC598_001222 [Morganella morganii]|nr:hypothetical protein [Morganella morganii]